MKLPSEPWWNDIIGRSIRTIWHWVGVYAVLSTVGEALVRVAVLGGPPAIGPVPAHQALAIISSIAIATTLTVRRPGVSSARTLAFGLLGTAVFWLFQRVTVVKLAGNLLVVLDVSLAAIAAISLSVVVAYGFDSAEVWPKRTEQ